MADNVMGERGEGTTDAGSTSQNQGTQPTQAYDYANYGGRGAAYSPSTGYVETGNQPGSQAGQTVQQPQPVHSIPLYFRNIFSSLALA